MQLGLCTITNKDASPVDIVYTAGDIGFDGVEVWGGHLDGPADETIDAIVTAAAEVGVTIETYGAYLRCGGDDFAAELDDDLATATALGANTIRVWAGEQEYGDHDAAHWEQVVADLQTVTERAASDGLTVTVEKHSGTLTNNADGAERLVEAVDHPACGLNYQPGFGIPAAQLEREAERLAPLSNQVHISGRRPDDSVVALDDAYFSVAAVLAPFRDRDFDGYVNLEFITDEHAYEAALQNDYGYLTSLL
jgi:sugar phosphate isomerase/epimerase